LEHDGTGGINSIVDGFKVANSIYKSHPKAYKILSETILPFEYKDAGKHHFVHADSIFSHYRLSGKFERIRYNPHDLGLITKRNSFVEDVGDLYHSLSLLSNRIEENLVWIKLTPGRILFLDNWRSLHGRTAFTGKRRLCGCYISRSDWQSKARVL